MTTKYYVRTWLGFYREKALGENKENEQDADFSYVSI